ncbi:MULTISPECIES: hypothetical protein [unclassified Paracoccus (in: a-proteobacteria)]|uniref:hypothetical protein n=1 Tax=unclassified Paracoccus (in: a-proteobacteria) TaxID=2688777 RepID=UPI0015FEEC58|nr:MULTISPECIES: hypothetical protein [unclassified Paracoccus (in: a-proteobacteria)]MBB1490783.1 hypothetical protein [Paracoccus sp. MC1854]MBB1497374.1 hypothetical protein [Paracoccus sp. MC1862]QQO45867.1 hypothetical protein JGR78_06070 [Paracoccus sp. MC1862]
MLKKLLPVVLSAVAFLGGAAGGEMLKRGGSAETAVSVDANTAVGGGTVPVTAGQEAADAPAPPQNAVADGHGSPPAPAAGHGKSPVGHGKTEGESGTAWFKFPQQFFVPVIHDGRLDSTMILALSVEMPAAARETVYAHEIKLRDALLRQLLIYANTGGFDGNFTTEVQLRKLRETLTATAQGVLPEISGILIGDIARQER